MLILLALSAGAAFSSSLRLVVAGLDSAFVAVCVFDMLRTPRPDRLDVRRRVPARAGQGRELVRTLRVDASAVPLAGGLVLEIDEEFPASFTVLARTWLAPSRVVHAKNGAHPGTIAAQVDDPSGGPDAVRLPGSGPIDLVRVYRTGLRGNHALGDLRLRITSRLGLVERSARIHARQIIAVEPALLGLRRSLALAASRRWRDLGARTTRRRGGLQEFESLREHVPGDDVRTVDWKAFAKRGRPIVRQFQEERGQELIIAIDCGRRMAATTAEDLRVLDRRGSGVARGMTKLDHALDAALQLAAVALEHGDRVGVLAFDSDVRAWVPPTRGRAQLARMREAIFALESRAKESNLERALRELALLHRRRALVLVLSDVADPHSLERQRAALHSGSGRHRVIFAGLDDPALRAIADGKLAADAALRAGAIELVEERRAALARLSGGGVRVFDALPAEAAGPAIAAWLDARSRA